MIYDLSLIIYHLSCVSIHFLRLCHIICDIICDIREKYEKYDRFSSHENRYLWLSIHLLCVNHGQINGTGLLHYYRCNDVSLTFQRIIEKEFFALEQLNCAIKKK